jgi:predicted alpha/beta superfamily hydrolase
LIKRRAAVALLGAASLTVRAEVRVLSERLPMPGLNRERTLRLYLPPSYAHEPARRYPAIYLHDGQNLFDAATAPFGEWGVDEALDALAASHGFEAIAVGIDHGGDLRIQEMLPRPHERYTLAEGDAYVDFVARSVKPWIDSRFRTRPEREHSATIGSSLGGLMAHHALSRHPQVFGLAGVFSPAYWAAPSMFDASARLEAGTRVVLYAGTQESDTMLPLTERMHARLRALPGVEASLQVAEDARHNEAAWRAALPAALRWLYRIA